MKVKINYIPDGTRIMPLDGESQVKEVTDSGLYVTDGEPDAIRDKYLPTIYVRDIQGVIILGDQIIIGVHRA